MSMLGYPGSSGATNIDFTVVDRHTVPDESFSYFSEDLLYQAPAFACYAPTKSLTCERSDVPGLRLGSTHKIHKINADVVALWSEVLREIPEAKLCIYRDQLCSRSIARLTLDFQNMGIESHRLEFHQNVFRQEGYLSIYRDIDILLDVQPWSGHITACEALMMGVPTITLMGKNHAGRMVSSLLTTLGRTEWIAEAAEEYPSCVSAAVASWSSSQREGLKQAFLSSPLCDGVRYTQCFEHALRQILSRRGIELNWPEK